MRTLFLLFLFLSSLQVIGQKALTVIPGKPKPGDKITINYNSTATNLSAVANFEAYAYLIEGKAPLVREIILTKKCNEFTGTVQTNDTTLAVFFTFTKEDKRDNNNDDGYFTMLYTKEGTPVPGARFSVGQGLTSWGWIWSLKRNPDASKWIKDDFTANPELRKKFQNEYLTMLGQSKEEADKELLKKEIAASISRPDVKESEFTEAVFLYERVLKDKEKAAELTKAMKEKFPQGLWVKNDKVNAFHAEKDPEKKEALYKEIIEKFPAKNEQEEHTNGFLAYALVTAFGNSGSYDKMKKYASKVKNKSNLSGAYNNIAWKMAGSGINGKPGNVELGKELSWQSLQFTEEQMNSTKDIPPYYTAKQWKQQLESTYYMYADTYALLLYHLKDYKNAYEYQKKGIAHSKGNDVDMNQSYTVYVEKVQGEKAAQEELENFIRRGKYSTAMKDQLKRIYLAQNKTEQEWISHIGELDKASLEKKKEELAKKMISETAPPFTIKDIEGTEVSLASLKGKIVVVDFWATWCGPCIASFPGMKKAVEKYKQDPDVRFVFIDTWENGDRDKVKKSVGDFIQKNAYPFHVLMDYDSKVVEQYKVDGIPTKFVIDKNNNIRFKGVGYGGNADGLADELALMIEMSRTGK